MTYQLISGYKEQAIYRKSFFKLAHETFGLNFQTWYDLGFWDDHYECYSFIDHNQIIANVSVNLITVVIDDLPHSAMQIGTVMTAPQYRQQGLAQKLIEHVMALYQPQVDFIYLFANQSVLNFYPKFGFNHLIESHYQADVQENRLRAVTPLACRQLSVEKLADRQLLKLYSQQRQLNSQRLDIQDSAHLWAFYYILAFPERCYYFAKEEAIIMCEVIESTLHVYGLMQLKKSDYRPLLSTFLTADVTTIHFYFVPEESGLTINTTLATKTDDYLFVYSKTALAEGPFQFPLTSHA